MTPLDPQKFNLENQYQRFLGRIGLAEDKMHPQQKIQIKQTFFASWGQLLDCMISDISALPEMDGVAILEHMDRQVKDYFDAESKRQKAGS